MKIGILQTGHSPDELVGRLGHYDQMFERLLDGQGFEFETFQVVDMEFPPDLNAADGWLITGSKHGVYEDHAFIPPLEDLIRAIKAKGAPLAGVCFGHQIIAQALGGKVVKFDKGWAVGRQEYQFGDTTYAIHAWHQDQVIERPEGAEVFASNAFCENAGLVYGEQIWTIQAHPEFGDAFIDGLIKTRGRGVVPDAQLEAASALLETPLDSPKIGVQMAAFFKSAYAQSNRETAS